MKRCTTFAQFSSQAQIGSEGRGAAGRAAAVLLGILLLLAAAPVSVVAQDSAAGATDPAAGFIHATVTWPSGDSKTGFLRWSDEEAFWDDLFQSGYRDLVWGEYADADQLRADRRKEYFATHGLVDRLMYSIHEDKKNPLGSRIFVSRFGDLRSIEIHDGADDYVVTADGARHQIGGYGSDAGARLRLYVPGEEMEKIRWNDLSGIVFSPAPAGAVPYAERLYGRLESTEGPLEGFIQWDQSECTSSDILDGKVEREDVKTPMGEIRSITRARDNSADLVLKDGTTRNLSGSNDVDSGNRGIMVEVADFGRITVPWNRFVSLTFSEGHGSGPGRSSYDNGGPLQGQVTDTAGNVHAGRLVFDLDEAWRWDLFNGKDSRGLEYNLPFHNLARLEPGPDNTCRVTLRGGQVLELGEDQDTGRENAGVLVFATAGAEPVHVIWSDVRNIVLGP